MSFESFYGNTEDDKEKLPERVEIISMLKNRGIEDPEVKASLIKYVEAQELLIDNLEDNEERIEVTLHMAEIYFEGGYKEYAIESLEEIMETNVSEELFERIRNIYERFIL